MKRLNRISFLITISCFLISTPMIVASEDIIQADGVNENTTIDKLSISHDEIENVNEGLLSYDLFYQSSDSIDGMDIKPITGTIIAITNTNDDPVYHLVRGESLKDNIEDVYYEAITESNLKVIMAKTNDTYKVESVSQSNTINDQGLSVNPDQLKSVLEDSNMKYDKLTYYRSYVYDFIIVSIDDGKHFIINYNNDDNKALIEITKYQIYTKEELVTLLNTYIGNDLNTNSCNQSCIIFDEPNTGLNTFITIMGISVILTGLYYYFIVRKRRQ